MKNLINPKFAFLAILFVLLFSVSADAQRRRTTRKTTRATAAKPATTSYTNAIAVRQASQTVANQVKNLSQFLYLLGGSVASIRTLEAEARTGKLSAADKQKTEAGKKGIILTITTFKNAMVKLETDFRANPALKPYLLQLTGVGDTAATAEDQARAGQFDQAGRTLIQLVDQLTTVLVEMR